MSDSAGEPLAPTFERARELAKQLLRACRSRDAAALARVRAQLPRLAALDVAAAAAHVRLADVQHALARESGLQNWAALKHHIEGLEPFLAQVERFLRAMPEGDLGTMRRVLERFPDVARTSVHAACAACDAGLVEHWLARDPALATATLGTSAWTPLDCLAASPLFSLDAAHAAASVAIGERLLALGASPNQFTPQPGGPPEVKLTVLYRASQNGNAPLVRLLLERGADPNDGESTYHSAERNHREVLELLLAHGAEISATHAYWKNTLLYYLAGCREGDARTLAATEGMRWLLEHGADPNVPSGAERETPLHRIADFGREAAVAELLLAHGADPHLARSDGRTAHALAVRAGNTAVAALLVAHGAAGPVRPVDALLGACATGDVEAAQRLRAEHPGLVDTLAPEDRMATVRAAAYGRAGAPSALAALGFDVGSEQQHGGTPLHWAAWRGRVEIVRELLALGVPLNPRDSMYGSSPIAWAAHGSVNCRSADEDYVAVVDLLLDAGATRPESYNRWNEPPEALASDAVAEHLRARGFVPAP